MSRLILKRCLYGALTLLATSLLIFLVTDAMPGDFASTLLGREYSQQVGDVIREKLGLYQSLPERYAQWLVRMAQFDFGRAFSGYAIQPAVEIRLQRTLWLAFFAGLVSFPTGIALGVYTALRRYTPTDRALVNTSTVMISTPEFLVGYALLGFLSAGLGWFPGLALVDDTASLLEKLNAAVLPIVTLAIVTIPPVMRIVRASLINTMSDPYVEMAVLKGLTPARIMFRHVLPNNVGAIANAISLGLAALITGVIVVEIVFVYPGLGTLFVDAVGSRDVPVIQACSVIFSGIYIVLLLMADIVSIAASPRLVSKQAMEYITPGNLRTGYKIAIAVCAAGLVVFIVRGLGDNPPIATFDPRVLVAETGNESIRSRATHAELMDNDIDLREPLQNNMFLPLGEHTKAIHRFNSVLKISRTEITGRRAGGMPRTGFGFFPALSIDFVSHGDTLIPIQQGIFETDNPRWNLLVDAGKIWSEESDQGYSRASFPFTLIGKIDGSARQGLALFTFNDERVSNIRYQIVQESAPDYKFDAWGQLAAEKVGVQHPNAKEIIKDYLAFEKKREPLVPWEKLPEWIDPELLNYFDGVTGREHITTSGMIIDDVIYSRGCHTRYGAYPYCDSMRHSVFSVSKSMAAALALLRLAEKYGDSVLDEKILDYVDIRADHDGWENVRFRDAIDMATGIGNVAPMRVADFVDGDGSQLSAALFAEQTVEKKIVAMGEFAKYPWNPGEVLRYRTADTFVLSMAMDRFLKSRQGPDAQLWNMMLEEVYRPIGIRKLPTTYAGDENPRNRVPQLGWQLFVTVDDIAKVVKLIRNRGQYGAVQILHRDLTERLLDVDRTSGLPSGWYYRQGGQAHYKMSLWLIPYRGVNDCWIVAPAMSGYGGNYVIMVPNGVTAFRLADGFTDSPATYESYFMRRIADYVRPSCE